MDQGLPRTAADEPLARTEEEDRWLAWDSFVAATAESGFMQSSWWANFRASLGIEYFGVTLKDGDEIVGGAMVTKVWHRPRKCFYYIQDGPALPADGALAAQVFQRILEVVEKHRRAQARSVSHLRIEPRWQRLPEFVQGFGVPAVRDRYAEPRNTLCIDLRPAEDEILAQMKPKGRYNIRLARRHGVSVQEDTSAQGAADFARIYRRTALRQGVEPKPPSYFRELLATAPARQALLFFASHRGRRLAAALVVLFGRRATYFYGGSLALRREVMAPYLLHFEIMRYAKALGCDWYDLWGVAPQDQPGHKWRDISVFKRKFGGVEVALVPTLDCVYDRRAYERFLAAERDSSGC